MIDVPLSALFAALAVLLIISGFFSLAETAMMAANRYRLRHLAQEGHRGARLALDLLARTDRLLGVILLFNNLINAAAATLVSVIAIQLFGEEDWALGAGTLLVTFLILVFAEITPKVVGAGNADRLAPAVSFLLTPLLRLFQPVVWFVNLFVETLLILTRLKPKSSGEVPQLSPEELRTLVLEAGHFIPHQHQSILLNLFDLESITVEDIMIPRGAIEAIDLAAPIEVIRQQLATSYHTRLPVFENDLNNIVGILHQRRLLATLLAGSMDKECLREQLTEPYFIPAATPVYSQLQFFQENRERIGLVVDEYGEIQGLVTLEDIIEELIGKFTTTVPGCSGEIAWGHDGSTLVDGGRSLRELNRKLNLSLPLEGAKTLNGLILEHFQDIPETGVSLKIAGVPMEIIQTQDRMVKTVRLFTPLT
ncbi:MAG: HlyC/CorC family transporter [Rhodocyclales bacterium]|nr:HlyC/CorC family transporter [Rhodocyclales bacterium]